MSSSKINPWEFFLNDTSLDNELAFRSVSAFVTAKRQSEVMYRTLNKSLQPPDFETRDILFTGKTKEELENENIFDYAKKHYQSGASIDSSFKYTNTMKECYRKKYFFYHDARKLKPETKELYESQKAINHAIREYKLQSQVFFSLLGLGIAGALGLMNNPMFQRIASVFTGFLAGTFYGEYKYANKIFDSIPPLPDKDLEKKRQDIYNFCFSVDIEYNIVKNYLITRQISGHIKKQIALPTE